MPYTIIDSYTLPARPTGLDYSSTRGDIAVIMRNSNDISILRWDGTNLVLVTTYTMPGDSLYCRPVFSPDGNFIAVSYNAPPYFSLLSWDGVNIAVADTYALASYCFRSSFSADGQYIAVTYGHAPPNDFLYVLTWDGTNLGFGDSFQTGLASRHVSFAPDGQHVVVSNNTTLFLLTWNGVNLALVTSVPIGSTNDMRYSPDGNYIHVSCDVAPGTRILNSLTLATIDTYVTGVGAGPWAPGSSTRLGLGGTFADETFHDMSWDGVNLAERDSFYLAKPIYGVGFSADGRDVALANYLEDRVEIIRSSIVLPTVSTKNKAYALAREEL